jgi:glucose-6-phosphate dehydrogenase assembly protein OpcA
VEGDAVKPPASAGPHHHSLDILARIANKAITNPITLIAPQRAAPLSAGGARK